MINPSQGLKPELASHLTADDIAIALLWISALRELGPTLIGGSDQALEVKLEGILTRKNKRAEMLLSPIQRWIKRMTDKVTEGAASLAAHLTISAAESNIITVLLNHWGDRSPLKTLESWRVKTDHAEGIAVSEDGARWSFTFLLEGDSPPEILELSGGADEESPA